MNKADFQQLVSKYLQGTASEEEKALLEQYYRQLAVRIEPLPHEDEEKLRLDMLSNILERTGISKTRAAGIRRMGVFRRYAATAAVLIGVSYGTYFLLKNRVPDRTPVIAVVKADAAPGGNRAILTLSNGSQIFLDSARNGLLAQQGGASITKTDSGQLAYKTSIEKPTEIVFNTLSTPRGGQYQLTLPDGTRVWLNAASSIYYPTAFTGGKREVEISGEAYFEVAHNAAMPFIVSRKDDDAKIQVLGTHFNVNGYDDEQELKITLLEGSVKVSKGVKNALLKPGQQANINRNGSLTINKDADLEAALAWKNGVFEFHSADLTEVMRQLSRWYDVDIIYSGKAPDRLFEGEMERNLNLSQVLAILEKNQVHFKIDGKKLTVQP